MSDGVTHNGQPVVPYQCLGEDYPCGGTFENPCPSSAAGRIVARHKPMPAWLVKRDTVRVGDVYAVMSTDEWHPKTRRCRVVKLVVDNDDDGIVPFYIVVVRHDDGTPDRKLCGPEIEHCLRRIT